MLGWTISLGSRRSPSRLSSDGHYRAPTRRRDHVRVRVGLHSFSSPGTSSTNSRCSREMGVDVCKPKPRGQKQKPPTVNGYALSAMRTRLGLVNVLSLVSSGGGNRDAWQRHCRRLGHGAQPPAGPAPALCAAPAHGAASAVRARPGRCISADDVRCGLASRTTSSRDKAHMTQHTTLRAILSR